MILAVGIIIGLALGLTGAGGSILAVPLLILLLGFDPATAMGISLVAVAASAAFGIALNLRAGNIVWTPAIILAITGSLTAPFGRLFSTYLPETLLSIGFSLLALIVAARMWRASYKRPEHATVVRASKIRDQEPKELLCKLSPTERFELKLPCIMGLAGGGALVGVLSGLFGVGGGFLIVPLLLALSIIRIQRAVATSLVIILFVSSSGFISFLQMNAEFDLLQVSWLIVGSLLGMLLGFMLAKRLAPVMLQRTFAIGILIITATMLFRMTLI